MKKIGLICLALILALGGLGVGYAHWTDTLYIEGDINNGWVDVNFASQYDNDLDDNDPTGPGEWLDLDIEDPWWNGARDTKDVASTTSTYVGWDGKYPSDFGNEAEIIITNGYPSYWGSVLWDIENNGSVPVELWTVNLTAVDGPGAAWGAGRFPIALDIGVRYYVDADNPGDIHIGPLAAGDDFSFILSAYNTTQLDPYTSSWGYPVGYLDITVHIEQDSAQKTSYEFTIEYVFANWNEVP